MQSFFWLCWLLSANAQYNTKLARAKQNLKKKKHSEKRNEDQENVVVDASTNELYNNKFYIESNKNAKSHFQIFYVQLII